MRKRETKRDVLNGGKRKVYLSSPTESSNTITVEGFAVPKQFPQVSVLTSRVLSKEGLNNFVWLEKTDGLNQTLILINDSVYRIHNRAASKLPELRVHGVLPTVIMTELYEDEYYVFDAHTVNGKDVTQLMFPERMKAVRDYLDSVDIPFLNIKEFYPIESIGQLLTFLGEERSPITGNFVDGVICQCVTKPFNEVQAYKLKRRSMNTIDFRLRYDTRRKRFNLYLLASPIDYYQSPRRYTRKHEVLNPDSHNPVDINTIDQNGRVEILFTTTYDTPFYFQPRKLWNTSGYLSRSIEEVNTLMSNIYGEPQRFHNAIVECSLADDGWVPLRVRNDKPYPNRWEVGTSNAGVIFAPLTDGELYFSKNITTDEWLVSTYHAVNRIVRNCMFEDALHNNNGFINVLDLAGGRGADEQVLYAYGARNIFATDADRDALVQYSERTRTLYKRRYEHVMFPPNQFKRSTLTLNVVYTMLGRNNQRYVDEIKNRYEYPTDGFNFGVMNYAIHYLCYNEECMNALRSMVEALMHRDGRFMFTYFDGDAILSDMGRKNTLVLNEHFKIEKVPNISGDSPQCVRAKMPLPTISETGYREEPLATRHMLDLFVKGFTIIDTYAPFERYRKYVETVPHYEKVEPYLKYIRVCIMSLHQ